MSTIQNFKNFLRHGKQARAANSPPHAEPTTNVQNVHAHQQRFDQQLHGISEPNVYDHRPLQAGAQFQGDFSAAAIDHRNVAAKAGDVAARAAGDHQKKQAAHAARTKDRKAEYDPTVIERIVAEERESKGKLPRYPGLERYTLLEKMGDGAFSNVYHAKDNTGQYGEVAIKVVRKFEMNNTQVRTPSSLYSIFCIFHTPYYFTPSLISPLYDRFGSLCQHRGGLGSQRTTSGLQEGAKDSRGAHFRIFTTFRNTMRLAVAIFRREPP
jgi:hypothetical protein